MFHLYLLHNVSSGMLDSGVGPTKVRKLLATLNIPPISQTSLKRCEREVGDHIEAAAQESVTKALQQEIELTKNEK